MAKKSKTQPKNIQQVKNKGKKVPLDKKGVKTLLQTEKPVDNEVSLNLFIKDIKYGNNQINDPEATTIYEGRKISFKVPFEKKLNYKFRTVEDQMVFKFAVTSEGDLLGFLYLEIPQKFKAMKEFKLDDWFPIKQLETEEDEKIKNLNFVARIIINYKAVKRLVVTEMFNTRVGTIQGKEELAKTMKQKLQDIHNAVDDYKDEGFRHLGDFEKKLIKKRINMMNFKNKSSKNKQLAKTYHVEQPLTQEKEQLYRTKNMITGHPDVKNYDVKTKDLFNFKANKYKKNTGDANYDKLLKELSHARKELIETKQKLLKVEQGFLTVDNIQLQKQLEKMKDELLKDKAELTIKLSEQNHIFGEQQEKMNQDFEQEKENLHELQNQAQALISEYETKISDIENTKFEQEETQTFINDKLKQMEDKEKKLEETQKKINQERENIEVTTDEIEELKERMMIERKRIFEESEHFNFEKGDLTLKAQQLQSLEDFLTKEKQKLEKEKHQIEQHKKKENDAIQGQFGLIKLEQDSLEKTKLDFDKKMVELKSFKDELDREKIRIWREKTNQQQEVKNFLQWKQIVEEESEQQKKDVEKDYQFIDEQLNLLELNKTDLNNFKENLQNYENYLDTQQRLLNEHEKKFEIMQNNFFQKLNNSQFDIRELKEYAKTVGIKLNEESQKIKDNQKYQKKLNDQKELYKKNLEVLNIDSPENDIQYRRNTIQTRRATGQRFTKVNNVVQNMEEQFKLKQDANDIIENIFSNVCVNHLEKSQGKNVQLIETLQKKTEELQQLLDEERKNAKKMKLAHFVMEKAKKSGAKIQEENKQQTVEVQTSQGNFNQKKSVTIQEPRTLQKQSPSQQGMRQSMASMETLREPAKLGALRQDVLDICDISIDYLEENIAMAKDENKIKERIEFLQRSQKMLKNVFKMLNLIHNSKKDFDNKVMQKMDVFNEEFDFERLKTNYEEKIKSLVDYIKKIRENNDFFNFNYDRNVLVVQQPLINLIQIQFQSQLIYQIFQKTLKKLFNLIIL